MTIAETLHQAYTEAKNYPQLVQMLIKAGVQSYTVETSSGTILYRFPDGQTHIHANEIPVKIVAQVFTESAVIQAIRDNQKGKSDYPGFMRAIADAGVRFYEATLNGDNKRVTYIGIGGYYEEAIPV